jgi:C-1 hydroxylase
VIDHLAAYNSHDVGKMASFWTEDVVLDDVGLGVIIRGKQEVKSYVRNAFAAIPDEKKELKSLFCAGNQAVCEMVDTGTQTGAFEKIPATGKSYSLRAVWVIELREGKIGRVASYYDALSFLQQLGLMPEALL